MLEKTPTLPIDIIRIPEILLRGIDNTSESFIYLVEDVRANGVQQPIKVREIPLSNGGVDYCLVDGMQRLGAAKEAGHTSIPVSVETMEDSKAMMASIRLNLQRSNPPPAAYGKYLKEYLARNPQMTVTALANELNYGKQWVEDRLSLTKLGPAAAKLTDSGDITAAHAVALAKLPLDEQDAFLARAQTMQALEFGQQVAERVKEVNAAKRAGKAQSPEPSFPATPTLRSRAELSYVLTCEPSDPIIAQAINDAGATDLAGAFQAAIKYIFKLDATTLAVRKAEWEAEQARLKEEREAAKAEREKAKLEAAAEKAKAASAEAGLKMLTT